MKKKEYILLTIKNITTSTTCSIVGSLLLKIRNNKKNILNLYD